MDGDAGLLETGARGRESTWVDAGAVFLLGAGGAWSAGNIGPVAADLGREFGIWPRFASACCRERSSSPR